MSKMCIRDRVIHLPVLLRIQMCIRDREKPEFLSRHATVYYYACGYFENS